MNEHSVTTIVSVLIAIMGLAVIAVLVSTGANTTGVLTAGGGAIQRALCVALSPVTGGGNCQATNVTSRITFGT